MEKRLIKNEEDILKAIKFFGEKWEKEIRDEINHLPTILVSCYCDDIEFGEYYQFTSINTLDIISLNHQDLCLN